MQHKPKVQKASAKERNSDRSEHRKCEKKKWEKNGKQKREEAKRDRTDEHKQRDSTRALK